MTEEKLQEFKTRLIAERKEIADKIHDQEEEEKSLYRENDDGFDEPANDPSLEILGKLTESESRLVEKIELALSRIENGTYGTCASCHGEIPIERLEAKPSVSLCRDCQTEHESSPGSQ